LNFKIEKPFAPYFGALCGVIGTTNFQNIAELKNQFEKIVDHQVSLYQYGSKKIKNNKIAVVAGGGNDVDILKEVAEENINTFVTGITVKNPHSQEAHDFAKKNKINILGGTHYSTEKFACLVMVDYFKKLNLPAEFIKNQPVIEDM
jgi:putative NIF3 family GTP cyclohydrolase 1 type 2